MSKGFKALHVGDCCSEVAVFNQWVITVCVFLCVAVYSTWHSLLQLNGFRKRQSSSTQEVTHPTGWVVISSWVSRWRQWWKTSHLSFTCFSFTALLRGRYSELYRTAHIKVIHVDCVLYLAIHHSAKDCLEVLKWPQTWAFKFLGYSSNWVMWKICNLFSVLLFTTPVHEMTITVIKNLFEGCKLVDGSCHGFFFSSILLKR